MNCGRLTLGGWLASLLRAGVIHDLFSWTDPLPFLLASRDRVRSRLRRARGQFTAWLQQWLSTAS